MLDLPENLKGAVPQTFWRRHGPRIVRGGRAMLAVLPVAVLSVLSAILPQMPPSDRGAWPVIVLFVFTGLGWLTAGFIGYRFCSPPEPEGWASAIAAGALANAAVAAFYAVVSVLSAASQSSESGLFAGLVFWAGIPFLLLGGLGGLARRLAGRSRKSS